MDEVPAYEALIIGNVIDVAALAVVANDTLTGADALAAKEAVNA